MCTITMRANQLNSTPVAFTIIVAKMYNGRTTGFSKANVMNTSFIAPYWVVK